MAKGTRDLFDAVDVEPTPFTAIDWIVWLFLQTASLAAATALWLGKQQQTDSGAGLDAEGEQPIFNPALEVVHAVKHIVSGGDILEVVSVIGFFLCGASLLLLQAGQRYVWRSVVASVGLGLWYSGGFDGWYRTVPIFVWTALLLSNVVHTILDIGKPASERKSVAGVM